MPLGLDQREGYTDDEQVVGVGEEAHAGHEHDFLVESRYLGVVQLLEDVLVARGCNGAHSDLLTSRAPFK